MFRINFQKTILYSLLLVSASMLSGMDLSSDTAGAGFNEQTAFARFINFRLPSFALRPARPNPMEPSIIEGVLTIALDLINPNSLVLANISAQNPSITGITITNPNGRSLTRAQLDLLGLFFNNIQSLTLVDITASWEELIFLNQFAELTHLDLSRCTLNLGKKRLRDILYFPKLKSFKK